MHSGTIHLIISCPFSWGLTTVTELFLRGAYSTLRKAQEVQATIVVLKENSPSCGSTMIYNGQFSGEKLSGNGVTSALLKRSGIQVISEHELESYLTLQ